MKLPWSCSSTLRNISNLRSQATNYVKYLIGDGSNTFLWLGPWHLKGALLKDLKKLGLDESLSTKLQNVSSILNGHCWRSLEIPCSHFSNYWDKLPFVPRIVNRQDQIV